MNALPFCLVAALAALVVTAGCASKSKAKLREQEAVIRGQQQAIAAQQLGQPVVWVRGLVRNPRVPWTEDLTLTRALAVAQWTDSFNPRSVRVIRQGRAYPIDIKRMLRGLDDPPLEPGDLIEIGR